MQVTIPLAEEHASTARNGKEMIAQTLERGPLMPCLNLGNQHISAQLGRFARAGPL